MGKGIACDEKWLAMVDALTAGHVAEGVVMRRLLAGRMLDEETRIQSGLTASVVVIALSGDERVGEYTALAVGRFTMFIARLTPEQLQQLRDDSEPVDKRPLAALEDLRRGTNPPRWELFNVRVGGITGPGLPAL